MTEFQRNMLILGAIALIVAFSTTGGLALGGASTLLQLAFTVVMIWFLVVLYQRNSGTIAIMPTGPRLLLQVAGLALLVIVATGTRIPLLPWPFGWGQVYPQLFWPGLLLCGFAIWWSWQQRTSKW